MEAVDTGGKIEQLIFRLSFQKFFDDRMVVWKPVGELSDERSNNIGWCLFALDGMIAIYECES